MIDKSIYSNPLFGDTELVFDRANGEAKGTILLIHGTAPQNIDGEIPLPELQDFLKENAPHHYALHPTYKALSGELNGLGWNTVRYTRPGVYADRVDLSLYCKTDLATIMEQLGAIWNNLPADSPKFAFAWSGGSVHILQLSLKDAAGIVILGGISTKRTEVYRLAAQNDEQKREIENYLNDTFSKKDAVGRNEMMNRDMPYGRFFDEDALAENWTYLKQYPNLPVLVLHGGEDEEVSPALAEVWKEKLPDNPIKTVIEPGMNHLYSPAGEAPSLFGLAASMDQWMSTVCR